MGTLSNAIIIVTLVTIDLCHTYISHMAYHAVLANIEASVSMSVE